MQFDIFICIVFVLVYVAGSFVASRPPSSSLRRTGTCKSITPIGSRNNSRSSYGRSTNDGNNASATNATNSELAELTSAVSASHKRVLENNKLRIFESMESKLTDLQSEFLQKYEVMKKICPDRLKSQYKFITMIRNEKCDLLVKKEDQVKAPTKIRK